MEASIGNGPFRLAEKFIRPLFSSQAEREPEFWTMELLTGLKLNALPIRLEKNLEMRHDKRQIAPLTSQQFYRLAN